MLNVHRGRGPSWSMCWNVRTTSGRLLGKFLPPSLCLLQLHLCLLQPPTQERVPAEALTDTTTYQAFLWLAFATQPGTGFHGHRDQLPWEKQNPGRFWRYKGWKELCVDNTSSSQTGTPLSTSRNSCHSSSPSSEDLTGQLTERVFLDMASSNEVSVG